jgi:hypothetical protein
MNSSSQGDAPSEKPRSVASSPLQFASLVMSNRYSIGCDDEDLNSNKTIAAAPNTANRGVQEQEAGRSDA